MFDFKRITIDIDNVFLLILGNICFVTHYKRLAKSFLLSTNIVCF